MRARSTFASLLQRPESEAALAALAAAGNRERVAVLCFEAEQHRCHREVVLQEAWRLFSASASDRPSLRCNATSSQSSTPWR
ncbi:DUF488 family protein [Plantactinospora sp. GCM10030261]|uniref:DUF488 family protein, N3 subclade n=1 Tax=Plantactinospora sp. GCM10030261 TaxID=3273420 RepID=UPI003616F65C